MTAPPSQPRGWREQRRDRSGDGDAYMSAPKEIEYRFYCEFQSHEPEFDYLKSLEIEEKINRLRWRHGSAGSLFLLPTNGARFCDLPLPLLALLPFCVGLTDAPLLAYLVLLADKPKFWKIYEKKSSHGLPAAEYPPSARTR